VKRWTDIGSDVNWVAYGGRWARKARDGSWYIVAFTNGPEAAGRDWTSDPYVAEVTRIVLSELSDAQLRSARECVGAEDGIDEIAQVEACVMYGHGAPLETFYGRRADSVRAKARRFAETMMRDEKHLKTQLARVVNGIGSTAEEYGRGDLSAALGRGPFDTAKQIVRHMQGLPRVPGESTGSTQPGAGSIPAPGTMRPRWTQQRKGGMQWTKTN